MRTFSGLDRWTPLSGLDALSSLLERFARSLQAGLNGRLELPDRRPTRGTLLGAPVPGNVFGEIVEVTFEANATEAKLEHQLDVLATNAVLVSSDQPFILGPGDTPADTAGLWRKAHKYHDGSTVVTTFPFKARFLVWGAQPERFQE